VAAIFAWIVANVLPAALKGLLGIGQATVQSAEQKADAVELGQARQARADQDQVIAAGGRMAAAAAEPRDDESTAGALKDGTF
jgi:hypothetical protein